MTIWDDLNARARGLATHLLGRPALEGMARAADLPTLAAELTRRGYPVEEGDRASAAGLELAARRALAARLRILIRWAGPRTETLAVVFEDEDRRSIAALVRGAVQHAPADGAPVGADPHPGPAGARPRRAGQPAFPGGAGLPADRLASPARAGAVTRRRSRAARPAPHRDCVEPRVRPTRPRRGET